MLKKKKTEKKDDWIKDAIKNPGALRKKLKVKDGKNITNEELEKASKSKNATTRKQANLAKTLKKMHKK